MGKKNFDHEGLARSITKMLDAAQSNIELPGASIATQRLIDYSSGEFGKLTPKQSIKVLQVIDKKFKKNLLKDGQGEIIGYVYSGKIFVSLKDNQKPTGTPSPAAHDAQGGGSQEDYAKKYAGQYMQGNGTESDISSAEKKSKKTHKLEQKAGDKKTSPHKGKPQKGDALKQYTKKYARKKH